MATYYVVGGGPSLKGFDFERLRGQRVIVANAAYVEVPWAEAVVFADQRFYEWQLGRPEWENFQGQKITTWSKDLPGTIYYGKTSYAALSRDPRVLAGTNSGEKAVNLAYLRGAKTIYLLGFDMQPNGNYHDRHLLAGRQNHYAKFQKSLTEMGHVLLARGVRVFNACKTSGVTVFPRIGLEDLPV